MATSPAKFYLGFLFVISIILWMIYMLLKWMLGLSVEFRVGGWKCLRDVVVKFETGVIESMSVSEIRLSFLTNLRNPKVQVLICGLKVVTRSSTSTTHVTHLQNSESKKSGMVVANLARFLSLSVTDMVVKTPKVIVEVKGLKLDINKDGGTKPNLYVELNVQPILVHLCESRITSDQSSNLIFERCSCSQPSPASPDKSSAALFCDELSVSSEFGHDREVGIVTRDMKIVFGDVVLYFDENLFPKSKGSSASIQDELGTSTTIASSTKKPHLLEALGTSFPEKVSFSLSKLDVNYQEHGLLAENNIKGIQLNSVKSKYVGDAGESTHLNVDMKLSEIHLFRKAESSILEITNIDMESFLNIPIQSDLPIRAKVDIKVGGSRCDLFMSRLQPWFRLHERVHGKTHTVRNSSQAVEMETIIWRCTVSAPKMTFMLYGLDGSNSPMYHFCSQPSLISAYNISSMETTIHVELSKLSLHLEDEPHTASIMSYASQECKRLKYSVSLEISQFCFCLTKDIDSILLELGRAKSIYKEYMEADTTCSTVTLFDMHNVKFVRRSGGLQEFDDCSLFSASDISLGWDPDVHLSFYELFWWLRSLVYVQRPSEDESGSNNGISSMKKSIFAIDVEMLTVSTKVRDGMEIKLEVESIFSENAFIGVLFERIILGFNGSRVLKSTRVQISRKPTSADAITWDWLLQGLDLHVCLPYKLQLRVIADSIQEMLEGLNLITIAREENISHGNRESSKPSPNFNRISFCIRRLIVDIEEEPMQGWLDEHYQLMKKEACELTARLNFLEKETSDPQAIKKAREEIHKRSFQSYYKACKGLVLSEGSGACREGFQAGFKPSTSRTSLLSICTTDFNLSLTPVRIDDAGLMEALKKLDPICQEKDILFSRLNGSNVRLNIGSLKVQLRNYTLPLLSVTSGNCEGRIMQLRAQEADEEKCISSGEPQISKDVCVGRWRKVKMFRPVIDTTPPMKTYSELRIQFEKGDVSFGVGYEPAFADISYAFSVALGALHVVKEEHILPWWDHMRNNVHGKITLSFSQSKWTVLATEDPYESQDKLQIVTGPMDFQQSDGRVLVNAKDFKIELSSLESLISRHSLEVPFATSRAAFFEASVFNLEVTMDWECESLDPFRSTSLSLWWNFSLASPIMTFGAHDLAWLLKFCGINSDPPNKLRSFSAWPRFRVSRVAIPENLSLDQVMKEVMLRVEATPFQIKYMPWDSDDPAKGLTFDMTKLKYELYFSRGKQKFTFECKRDALDLVYQGLDLHVLKAFISKDEHHRIIESVQLPDEGFLLSSDYLTIRKQSPKADAEKLLAWQEAGKTNLEMADVRSEFENGSKSNDRISSDSSDNDDEHNVVVADDCQRVFVYGLKLLWTIENRDFVQSFVGGISKAFKPPRPSPSRQYKQRKILEENQKESSSKMDPGGKFSSEKSYERVGEVETNETEEEGTRHFMVNVIKPQFNLHSEEANGNFLLAAVSGRVLARSFHSIMSVGMEVIEHALGSGSVQIPECIPDMTWTRMEYSIMLEHVQAHVAPTDLDPSAGLQWLPKISRNSPKDKRTGALLERVFMPCDMYLRYTRHKAGTPDLKVKPLKELTFNSHNITATMTSRQYQVMMDVLNNLLLARLPKPRKSSLQYPIEDEDVEEEADEIVPYGVEEVELAKINLEEKEWERKLLLDDIKKLSTCLEKMDNTHMERKSELWMISSRISKLVQELKKDLLCAQKSRKVAFANLRLALQKAAQLQLMEKEKNKSPPYAMCISLQINKIVWSMLLDGKSFAEAEINYMIYDFDRDYKDIGITQFTTKYFVVRNCLPNANSDILLSAWNPPPEWGKKCMLRVDSKHGAPKDGNDPLELFQVEIYPLRIHLTKTMYKMMWEYFFPEEEHDSQRRQEVYKTKKVEASRLSSTATSVSTTLQSQSNDNCVQKSNTLLNLKSSTVSSSKQKLKETKTVKKSKPNKMEVHNIKISQVELLITYEGSRLVVSDLGLLMDTFHRVEFTGTWRRLFSRVKKHIIWSVLKSLTGFQMKKFGKSQKNHVPTYNDLDLSDSDEMEKSDQYPVSWLRQSDGAGDGFVTSIRGLFSTQRRKAKAFVLRTMRGGEAVNEFHGDWSDSDVEFSPFARQLTITKAKKLIRRHTKKSQRGSTSHQRESLPSSSKETTAYQSDDSSSSSSYEDFHK